VAKTFVDTHYVIALVNRRDQYHERARALAARYRGTPAVLTDAVLLEIGNALARTFKREAVEVIEYFLSAADVEIVRLTPELFNQAFDLYTDHRDKAWGLMDCISFIVMREKGLTDVLTYDQHFIQAGFLALMRDDP
jgi:predicted nucleic acid-binding protein